MYTAAYNKSDYCSRHPYDPSCIRRRSVQSRRIKAAREKQLRKMKRRFAGICVFFLMLGAAAGIFAVSALKTDASPSHNWKTVYTSVYIDDGMTLSDLAHAYNTSGTVSNRSYIQKIKKINHINDSDIIHTGSYLTVPTYIED
jgi:cell division protein YceG involved in septum cleavage